MAKTATKKTTRPTVKKRARPAAKKTTRPTVKKRARPAAKKTTRPAAKKTTRPTAKKTARPKAKRATRSTVKTTVRPAVKKTAKPTTKKSAISAATAKHQAPVEIKLGKKLVKTMKKKKYRLCTACGKKYKMTAPAVWAKGWKEIMSLGSGGGRITPRFQCRRCGRLSPVKSYLCRPKSIEGASKKKSRNKGKKVKKK